MKHGSINTNGIDIHYVEAGSGPLVIFCHGFPESWYSWRHQLLAISQAGYHAVAMDMRGYGRTSRPQAVDAYVISELVADVSGLVTELGYRSAVVVGHDWGGPVAWYAALMRPDLFSAVAVLSVPYVAPMRLPRGVTLNDIMMANAGDREYYRLYFQAPGVAEKELEADVRRSLLAFFYTVSGDIVKDGTRQVGWNGYFPKGETLISQLVEPDSLPGWLTEQDLDFYVDEFRSSGFRGGINWYRNIVRLPELLAPFLGDRVTQPALYMYGEYDQICGNSPAVIEEMRTNLDNLQAAIRLPGAGHWLQQERPDEVNEALLTFLARSG
ncbi:MAG: pimeloyl-ACP methyl ester carboxylesterase [Parasphingorhabdus sp.]|jgi:pimeloyl-ACP methyl ester carboxylesterase